MPPVSSDIDGFGEFGENRSLSTLGWYQRSNTNTLLIFYATLQSDLWPEPNVQTTFIQYATTRVKIIFYFNSHVRMTCDCHSLRSFKVNNYRSRKSSDRQSHHNSFRPHYDRDESRQRPLQVFAPILWSTLKLDTTVPTGANPLRGSVIIFAPARCCYMTSYLTLCLLIRCDSFIAWILPELWKMYSLWAIVGCKLYKVVVVV